MPPKNETKIVIVDDSQEMLDLLGELLILKGYTVSLAYRSAQAMGMVHERQPHCVILDVVMPGLDGAAFAEELRATYGSRMRLIAMSGYPAEHPRVAKAFAIADHYLQKPFSDEALDTLLPDLV